MSSDKAATVQRTTPSQDQSTVDTSNPQAQSSVSPSIAGTNQATLAVSTQPSGVLSRTPVAATVSNVGDLAKQHVSHQPPVDMSQPQVYSPVAGAGNSAGQPVASQTSNASPLASAAAQFKPPSVVSPMAVMFPDSKACRLQFNFPAMEGRQTVTDDDDVFMFQLEKEGKMDLLAELNKSFKVTEVTVDTAKQLIVVRKKGRMSLEGGRNWIADVRGKIKTALGTVVSEVIHGDSLSADIYKSADKKFSDTKLSCLISHDKQDILLLSSDANEVARAKDFITAEMKKVKTTQPAKLATATVSSTASISSSVLGSITTPLLSTSQVSVTSVHAAGPSLRHTPKSSGHTVHASQTGLAAISGHVSHASTGTALPQVPLALVGPTILASPVVGSGGAQAARATNDVQLSDAEAKLLQNKTVQAEFLSKLMACEVMIGTEKLSSGIIPVKYGDPQKVKGVIDSILCHETLACQDTDKEVSSKLESLWEKFPAQIETTYDKGKSAFTVAFCKSIEKDVKPVLDSLRIVQRAILLPLHEAGYMHCNKTLLGTTLQSSLRSPVKIQLTKNSDGGPVLVVSAERAEFLKAEKMVSTFLEEIQQRELEPKAVLAMYLQGARGREEVKSIENKHNCQVKVTSPWHRLLWKQRSSRGHQILVCEGNMAAADCHMTVLTMNEEQQEWLPLQKHILDTNFLSSDLRVYARELDPKRRTIALHSNISIGDSTQRMGFAPSYGVAIMSVPKAANNNFGKSVREACEDVMAKLKDAKGTSIAFPLLQSPDAKTPDAKTIKCLGVMLSAFEKSLDQRKRACTVMLFVDQLTPTQSKKTLDAFKQTISPQWREDMGDEAGCSHEQPSQPSTPSILVCGRDKDVSACQKQVEKIKVPENFSRHASLLLDFLKDQTTCTPRVDETTRKETDPKNQMPLDSTVQHSAASFAPATGQHGTTMTATKRIPGTTGGVECSTSSGIKVSVYKTDITKLQVDAITNAANEHLAHGGGVAYAIARAAGFELEDEGQDYIRRHGPLKVTDVAVTTGGSLPCKKVLHAVGPRWYDYKDKAVCQQHLIDTVYNCLQTADNLGFTSLALPCISSAIFGVPMQVCAESYLSAVHRYDQDKGHKTNLKHIHFVDVSDDKVCCIQQTFREKWQTVAGQQVVRGKVLGLTTIAPPSKIDAVTAADNSDFRTPSGMKVSVYKTDITKLQVDAITNAANENLAHGGGVAYAIARAAGFELEDEGEDYIRRHGPLKVTDVAVTTGGCLPCKKVLHAVGPRWYDYKDKAVCQQHLIDTVYNCLQTADNLGFTSLALPSISSAIFGVPKQVCAESYLSAVHRYDQDKGHKTNLRHIHFVDVSDDMVCCIQQTFREKWQTAAGQQVVRSKVLGLTTIAPPSKIDAVTAADNSDFRTPSGMKVSVYKTDITKLPVEAITNAANENLAHGGGVAYAIARAAGFELEDEGEDYIRRHGPLKVTDVAVTTGGCLPCKKVLHAVGPRWHDYKDKAVCQQHLIDTVYNCLQTADNLGFTSLALPSISSAIFGVPKQVCAESYLSAVHRYDQDKGHKTNLRHIHFVDVSDDMVCCIQQTFREKWQTAAGQQVVRSKVLGLTTIAPPSKIDAVTAADNSDFRTPSGMKVSVYKTDITKLPVEAITNAANENLAHGGGVAYAIARAAGFELEDEGEDYIRRHGPLKVTDVAVTTGGCLPCKKVLHAVGPRWHDYKDKAVCQQHLIDTVYNCLQTADNLGFTSLALPSISSAIFGVPKQVCAESYLSAVHRYDQDKGHKTNLRHIHFVDVSDDMVCCIQQTFREKWQTAAGQQVVRSKVLGLTTIAPPSKIDAVTAADNSDFRTPSGMKVSVYKTDITKLPVEAITNAANEHLNHGGGVAYAIARAAGFELEEEGDAYIRKHGPLKVTDVAVTTAGSLPCKKVLHAVGPRWSDYKDKAACQNDLVKTVFNCLEKAHNSGFYSVAIPPISSAIFGDPREVCAASYLSAVNLFNKQHGVSTTLNYIHFVDVNETMISTIQKCFEVGSDSSGCLKIVTETV